MNLLRSLLFAAGLAGALSAPVADFVQPGPVTRAAPFSLKTPEGQTVNYPQDAQGQPTVLLFWPSWCPFSRALQPYVQDIWNDYRGAGVKVWTINILESGDPVQAMKDRGLSFPLLLQGDALRKPYGIERTPWFLVIDGQQNIVYTRPPNPPTPVDVARDARAALNRLLGSKAVPLPTSYPPPYDLHLKKAGDLVDRTAPKPVPESEWVAWVDRYLATIPPDEPAPDLAPRGALPTGKAALAAAKSVWTELYGENEVQRQAPYRAFRRQARWVVMGQGLDRRLGEGLIVVLDVDSGRVVRVVHGPTPVP